MFSSTALNKAIVLSPLTGLTTPPPLPRNQNPEADIQAWGNLDKNGKDGFIQETNTNVVRLWADWSSIQRFGTGFEGTTLQVLDANIKAAKDKQLDVILTTRGFPGWVTGYATEDGVTPGRRIPFENEPTLQQYLDKFPKPVSAATTAAATRIFNAGTQDFAAGGRDFLLRWPGVVDADSNGAGSTNPNVPHPELFAANQPWNDWITFLARRYHPGKTFAAADYSTPNQVGPPPRLAGAKIDVLEIINEPNLECWPQVAANNKYVQIAPVNTSAVLVQGAKILTSVNTSASPALIFAAPAISDYFRSSNLATMVDPADPKKKKRIPDPVTMRIAAPYDRFMKHVIMGLAISFDPTENFLFTHHNYKDIESAKTKQPRVGKLATTGTRSSAWMANLILGNGPRIKRTAGSKHTAPFTWPGWPAKEHPSLALTEGGSRLKPNDDDNSKSLQRKQADEVAAQHRVVRKGKFNATICLFSQFLSWESPIDPSNPTTRSHLVNRTIPAGFPLAGMDITALPATAAGEPSKGEYEKMQRTLYGVWTTLPKSKTAP